MQFSLNKPKQRAGVLRIGAILFIVAGLLSFADDAHATTLYGSVDSSVLSSSIPDNAVQKLGQFTGGETIDAIAFTIYKTSGGSVGSLVNFRRCNNSDYTSCSNLNGSTKETISHVGDKYVMRYELSSPQVLDASKYYALIFQKSGDDGSYGNNLAQFNGQTGGVDGSASAAITNFAFALCDDFATCDLVAPPASDTSTRIISTEPAGGSVNATSTSFVFSADGYLNEDDLNSGTQVILRVHNLYATQSNLIGPLFSGLFGSPFSTEGQEPFDETYETTLIESGDFEVNKVASVLGIGEYFMDITIRKSSGFLGLFNDTVFSTSTSFLVATTTAFGQFSEVINASIASTTEALSNGIDACSWTGDFDFFGCLYSLAIVLFIPDPSGLNQMFDDLKSEALDSFPLGYITDFFSIVSTSTIGTLTPFSATVPTILPGAGSHISLDITNGFDWLLNSTTGPFISPEASTTVTFYEYTSTYWEILVYVLAGLYILRRILGSHLVPHIGKPHN